MTPTGTYIRILKMIYLKVVSRPFDFLSSCLVFTLSLIQVHFLFSKTTVEFTRPNQFKFRHKFLYEHGMLYICRTLNAALNFLFVIYIFLFVIYIFCIKNPIDQNLFMQYEFYCGFQWINSFFGKVMAMIGLKFIE